MVGVVAIVKSPLSRAGEWITIGALVGEVTHVGYLGVTLVPPGSRPSLGAPSVDALEAGAPPDGRAAHRARDSIDLRADPQKVLEILAALEGQERPPEARPGTPSAHGGRDLCLRLSGPSGRLRDTQSAWVALAAAAGLAVGGRAVSTVAGPAAGDGAGGAGVRRQRSAQPRSPARQRPASTCWREAHRPLGIGLFDDISQQLLAPALALAVTWMGWLHGMQLFDRRVSRPSRRVAWAALLEAGAVGDRRDVRAAPRGAAVRGFASSPARPRSGSRSLAGAIFLFELFGELFGSRPPESGSPSRFLEQVSNLDCLVPAIGLVVLLLLLPAPHAAAPLVSSSWAPAVFVVALGLMMGLVFLLAVGRRAPIERGWLVLLGGTILSAGVAGQLGIPELVVGFVAGAVTAQSVGGRRISPTWSPRASGRWRC